MGLEWLAKAFGLYYASDSQGEEQGKKKGEGEQWGFNLAAVIKLLVLEEILQVTNFNFQHSTGKEIDSQKGEVTYLR